MQRREDSEHLLFPPDVYDSLKRRYVERIDAMLAYANDERHCRSRLLLRYFGETNSHDCGICDVCCTRADTLFTEAELQQAHEEILQLLSDGQSHDIQQLHRINLPYEAIEAALQHLIAEEIILDDDGWLVKP